MVWFALYCCGGLLAGGVSFHKDLLKYSQMQSAMREAGVIRAYSKSAVRLILGAVKNFLSHRSTMKEGWETRGGARIARSVVQHLHTLLVRSAERQIVRSNYCENAG